MRRIGFAILCIAVVLGVTSCKEELFPENDKAISFASTSEQLLTRGTPIDSDLDIPNMGVFAYYTGNGVSSNKWSSTAIPNFMYDIQVTNNSGTWSYANPVYWPAANDANISFFAYSPFATGVYDATNNPTGNGITIAVTAGIPTITYTVPESCAAQPDLMVSALKNDLNKVSGSPVVSFTMNHTLTSVGFKASGQGEEITGIKITDVITSGVLTTSTNGSFSWDISSSGMDDFVAIPNQITLDTTSTEVIEANGYMMMIPQTLGANSKLILTFSDGNEIEFDLSGQIWSYGNKVIYNISLISEDVLIITEIETFDNNNSSKAFTVTSTTGSGTPEPWTTDYSTDNGVSWTSTCPSWLTSFPASGPGGITSHTATVSTYAGANAEDLILAAATVVGTQATPYDLSTRGNSTLRNTANCYIINAPGYYQLPLVYGNAIKNGAPNPSAYTSSATSGAYLPVLLRHDDNPITDPYLYNQTVSSDVVPDNAVLVWQDASGLITNVNLTLDKHNLTFDVAQATIAQGNAILAVRNSSNMILWSWHIWVTPLVNADAPATDDVINAANVAFSFMQYNLGWCTIGSTPRSVMVRITQDGTSLSDTIVITQNPPISVNGGFAPYWQWGRKDPIPSSTGYSQADNTLFFGSGYSFIKGASTNASIGTSIQNPNIVYSAGSVDWCSTGGGGYFNMWSVHNIVNQLATTFVDKTVYDPSPVGFTVPAPCAWTGFSTANQVGLFSAGWNLSLPNTKTTFYPAAGIRNNGSGNLSSVNLGGYYWSAIPVSNAQSRTISFTEGGFTMSNATSPRSTGCSVRCALD